MKEFSFASLVPFYTAGAIGALLQVIGAYWDFSWHVLELADSFIAPAHLILYVGILITLITGITGVIKFRDIIIFSKPEGKLLVGLNLFVIAGIVQTVSGGFDLWWHSQFGFDPFIFTPSHVPLIAGFLINGVGVTIGCIRLLGKLGSSRLLQVLVVIGLATLWLDLNTLVILGTDANGIAYTFQIDEFHSSSYTPGFGVMLAVIALAGIGTFVLFTAKRILRRGAVTSVAVLSTAITTVTYLWFKASVLVGTQAGSDVLSIIPLYLSFLIPVFVFDMISLNKKRWVIVSAVLIAPFASLLDGWFSSELLISELIVIPLLAPFMALAGIVGALLAPRLFIVKSKYIAN